MEFIKDKLLARPFVKWVGGKTQLLDEVRQSLPGDFSTRKDITYVEPFVGGGAVLFWILQEFKNIRHAVINDVNPKLICTYRVIKSDVNALVQELEVLQNEYLPLDENARKEYYLNKRELFNNQDCAEVITASLFIFLNRTCFNGLYRVNSKGCFNVPHGKYANPRICDKDNLLAVSALLQNVEILDGDFTQTAKYAGSHSLYYLDPPYKPLNVTSSFTSYATDGFNDDDQRRLKSFCDQISAAGAIFIASNSDTKDCFFDNLYSHFNIKRVNASRMINSNPDRRGSISEIMISNVINL